MLNSPDTAAGSATPSEGSQEVQPGSGGEQAGQGPGGPPGVNYINVTEQEKEAIDRVCISAC